MQRDVSLFWYLMLIQHTCEDLVAPCVPTALLYGLIQLIILIQLLYGFVEPVWWNRLINKKIMKDTSTHGWSEDGI